MPALPLSIGEKKSWFKVKPNLNFSAVDVEKSYLEPPPNTPAFRTETLWVSVWQGVLSFVHPGVRSKREARGSLVPCVLAVTCSQQPLAYNAALPSTHHAFLWPRRHSQSRALIAAPQRGTEVHGCAAPANTPCTPSSIEERRLRPGRAEEESRAHGDQRKHGTSRDAGPTHFITGAQRGWL